ncbi:glycosyl hydrolase family 28-related protein [Azospirillum sp. sgz302134]
MSLLPTPRQFAVDQNGVPLAGGRLSFFLTGSSTPATVYSDAALTTPHTQPVIADSSGVWPAIYLGSDTYKVELKNPGGGTVWTQDPVSGSAGVRAMDSMTALRALTPGQGAAYGTVMLRGYSSVGDGGAGLFVWDASSAAADDGGTVIRPSSSTAAGRWLRVKVGPVSVKWFGAKGDGSTDDTAAIQAALNRTGDVLFPPGDYRASQALAVPSNTHARGAGRGATTVTFTTVTSDGFVFRVGATPSSMSSIADMTIDAAVTKTAGAAVYFNGATDCNAENLKIGNHAIGMRFTDSFLNSVRSITVAALTAGIGIGFLFDGAIGHNSDQYLTDCFVAGDFDPTKAPAAGYRFEQSGGTWLDTCGALACNNGVVLAPPSGKEVAHLFTTRCAIDTCHGHGWLVAPASGGRVKRCVSTEDWSCSSKGGHGIYAQASGGDIHAYDFIGMRSNGNAMGGAYVQAGVDVRFDGGQFLANGSSISNIYNGIHIGAGVSYFSVTGANCGAFPEFANTQRYGVYVEDGGSDHYSIIGNDLTANLSGGLYDGGAGRDKHVHSNVGVIAGFRQSGAGLVGEAGQALKVGMKAATPHQAGNVGSVGLTVEDGGGTSGLFIENTHDGAFSSQRIVGRVSWGGVVGATNRFTIERDGAITNGSITLFTAGGEWASVLRSYTVGTVPSPAAVAQMIYVSNESGGAVVAFSDGSNWRRVTDRAVIS